MIVLQYESFYVTSHYLCGMCVFLTVDTFPANPLSLCRVQFLHA